MARADGSERFETHFRALYGDRWEGLRAALTAAPRHATLSEGLLRPYYLDPASLAAARILPLEGTRRVLDLCAAPGGKTLALALALPPAGTLIANDRSSARRARLHRVLDEHLPPRLRARVVVTGHDARRWGLHETNAYDAVLADVPCSAEAHLIADPGELAGWSPTRITRLRATQSAILAAACDAAAPNGWILYATCALDPAENDGVVERVIARRGGKVAPVPIADDHPALAPLGGWERSDVGIWIRPDRTAGAGPIYCSLLRRTGAQ